MEPVRAQRSRPALVVGALMGAALVAGLLMVSRKGTQLSAGSEAAVTAREWLAGVELEYPPEPSIEALSSSSSAVAIVNVKSFTFPVWNSESGEAWSGSDSARPWVFTRVDVELQEQIAGEVKLPLGFAIMASGDASVRYGGDVPPPATYASGGFTEGGTYLVFLEEEKVPFESGEKTLLLLEGGFRGNYLIDEKGDALAVSASTGIPVDAMVAKIEAAAEPR